jgi:Uncharacterized protein conserved in bacteria (DUF2330)
MAGHARRFLFLCSLAAAALVLAPTTAFACGGLVAPGHAEVLQKATTLAAWHDGYEHYVTGFEFAGAANSFGYIIPLPGNPTKIQKAGDWTLERLEREINPVREVLASDTAAFAPVAHSVAVLQRKRVDALDITVVRGGGRDVAAWAKANGFDLTPDTPDVLARYSDAGAIFALAKFDALAAKGKGLVEGQGTVIHFTIPTSGPWIPLRILALGKVPQEIVDADLFILTDHPPMLGPAAEYPGMKIRASRAASPTLLQDLRSDRGMGWLPAKGMWFTALSLQAPAQAIAADLAIDSGGPIPPEAPATQWLPGMLMAMLALGALVLIVATAGRRTLRLQTP